jgi:microcystin-dependent protein
MPQHIHRENASNDAQNGTNDPTGNFLGSASNMYHSASDLTTTNPANVTGVGGGQAHLNRQPFVALTFCIALQGIFPSPN